MSVYVWTSERVSVRRAEELEVGGWYRFAGTASGLPVPPQVVRVESAPVFRGVTDIGYVEVTYWADLGSEVMDLRICRRVLMGLDQVNIPEHGLHDRHLEKIPEGLLRALGMLEEDNRRQDYGEMVGKGGG